MRASLQSLSAALKRHARFSAGWPIEGRPLRILAGAGLLGLAGALPAAADSAQLIIAAAGEPAAADAARAGAAQVRQAARPAPLQGGGFDLDPVETAALYYYAKERRTERVEAELNRLQALHPGYVPPRDLYSAADRNVPDETSLWALFAADDFTGIDAELIRRKAADPAWEPTDDFQTKLARKKLRVRMKELAEAEDWLALADIATAVDPATETDIDLVWMRIDALSQLGDRDGLARALRGLLTREGKDRLSDELLTVTLQKALRDFPSGEVRELAARLWAGGDGTAWPSSLRLDLARKDVADYNAEKDASPVSAETLRLLTLEARTGQRPEDLSLMGWHDLKAGAPETAEDWFTRALAVSPDAENVKGMYLSLARQPGNDARAYEFAARHLADLADDPVFLMNVLSPRFAKPGDQPLGSDAVVAYSTAIMETRAADHAEILGWYAYNSRQFEAAEAWFRQAYDWEASADRIKGLALTLMRLGRKKDYAALRSEFADAYPGIWPEIAAAPAPGARRAASVGEPQSGVRASYVKQFEARNYPACLRDIDRLGAAAAQPAVAVIRGWCELGLKRFSDARVSFETAMTGSGQVRTDAVYGAGLALLGARLTDEAEALVTAFPLTQERDRELKAEIYYQRARSSFDHSQFDRTLRALDARAALVAEPRDLTQMRAWANYHLGRMEQAKAIFRELNMVIRDTGAVAGLELIATRHERR